MAQGRREQGVTDGGGLHIEPRSLVEALHGDRQGLVEAGTRLLGGELCRPDRSHHPGDGRTHHRLELLTGVVRSRHEADHDLLSGGGPGVDACGDEDPGPHTSPLHGRVELVLGREHGHRQGFLGFDRSHDLQAQRIVVDVVHPDRGGEVTAELGPDEEDQRHREHEDEEDVRALAEHSLDVRPGNGEDLPHRVSLRRSRIAPMTPNTRPKRRRAPAAGRASVHGAPPEMSASPRMNHACGVR